MVSGVARAVGAEEVGTHAMRAQQRGQRRGRGVRSVRGALVRLVGQ